MLGEEVSLDQLYNMLGAFSAHMRKS